MVLLFPLVSPCQGPVASNSTLLQLTRATTEKTARNCPGAFMASDCIVILFGYDRNQSCIIITIFPTVFCYLPANLLVSVTVVL